MIHLYIHAKIKLMETHFMRKFRSDIVKENSLILYALYILYMYSQSPQIGVNYKLSNRGALFLNKLIQSTGDVL